MIGRKYDVGKGHVFTIRKIYYLSHPICQDRLSLYYIINDPQISAFLCNKKCILANIVQFCSQCLSTATALHVVTQWSRLLWNGGSVFARQSCFQITVVDRETGKWYRVFFFFFPTNSVQNSHVSFLLMYPLDRTIIFPLVTIRGLASRDSDKSRKLKNNHIMVHNQPKVQQ